MTKDSKKYIRYVKKLVPIHSKDTKEFINLLENKITEFENDKEQCNYQDIVDEFGAPNEIVGSYIESLDESTITKELNKSRIIKIISTVIVVLCVITWCSCMYIINQQYKEAYSDIHGHYGKEEIVEIE